MNTSNIKRFHEGWNEVLPEMETMPAGKVDPTTMKSTTWEELVALKSIFECFNLGKIEASRYKKSMSGEKE